MFVRMNIHRGLNAVKAPPEDDTQWVRNKNQPFQLSFRSSLAVYFHGSRVTSDGGLILVRELDERRGFSDLTAR